jgi:hypothetical protein
VGQPRTGGRKGRSASLPMWSDNDPAMKGALAAAARAATMSGNSMSVWDDPINVNRRMEKSRPPCQHYERNCTIIAFCCGMAFGCRICHDECPVLPMPIKRDPPAAATTAATAQAVTTTNTTGNSDSTNNNNNNQDRHPKKEKRRSLPLGWEEEETHHAIDRFAIAEVICRLCYTRQSSKT